MWGWTPNQVPRWPGQPPRWPGQTPKCEMKTVEEGRRGKREKGRNGHVMASRLRTWAGLALWEPGTQCDWNKGLPQIRASPPALWAPGRPEPLPRRAPNIRAEGGIQEEVEKDPGRGDGVEPNQCPHEVKPEARAHRTFA